MQMEDTGRSVAPCDADDVQTLTVLPAPPAAQGGATDRCAIGLLRGLRAHGVDVRTIAPDATGTWPAAARDLDVERVPVRPRVGMRATAAHLRRPLGDLAATALADAVRRASRDADLVHLEGSLMTWLSDATRPEVLSLHYRARLDRGFGAPWRAPSRELLLFRELERRGIRRHPWLVASSDVVAASIRSERRRADVTVVPLSLDPGDYPQAPLTGPPTAGMIRSERRRADVTVVPLSLDPGDYPQAPLTGPPTAGMIGWAAWPPTRDALARLTTSVWPVVRGRAADARLVLAGRGMSAAVMSDRGAGVDVVGEVESSQDFLAGLSVLVYPVRRGSGMKVKVLEAIASGVPVVTTSAGAEGIAPSEGVLVHDDESAFSTAVVRLLRDDDERRARGASARADFLARYAPLPATEPLVDLYRRILG
jgi:hypothetical protein